MKIFILEDDRERILYLRELFMDHEVTWAESVTDIDKFAGPYDLILLDHDLGGRQMEDHEDSGTEFCKLIKGRIEGALVIIHSFNGVAAKRMLDILGEGVAIYAPFRGSQFNKMMDLLGNL